jgi:hypothetical protein
MPLSLSRVSMSTNKDQQPGSSHQSSQSSSSGEDAEKKSKLFHEKLSILNENFLRFVQKSVHEVPNGDFVSPSQPIEKCE